MAHSDQIREYVYEESNSDESSVPSLFRDSSDSEYILSCEESHDSILGTIPRKRPQNVRANYTCQAKEINRKLQANFLTLFKLSLDLLPDVTVQTQ